MSEATIKRLEKEIDALGAVLKQALDAALKTQPEQEPMAWKILEGTGVSYLSSEPPPHPSVVASCRPLYTAPPQRTPLTCDQVMDIVDAERARVVNDEAKLGYRVARAIEAAHGIKEKV